MQNNNEKKASYFYLPTEKALKPYNIKDSGFAYLVDQSNFPALQGVTAYTLEVWEECMRLPHWHPNAAELGYVVSGEIEIILWRAPGETAMFTLKAGMCWFIPQGALHSLNNISKEKSLLLVGFSNELPKHVDLPVAMNGIPVEIRDAYTSPHAALRDWQGPSSNPLLGACPVKDIVKEVVTGSPYGFDLAQVTPLFADPAMGSVVWGVKSNWPILEQMSLLRARLKTNVARDPIWYPDVATLYVVTKGTAQFHIIVSGMKNEPFIVGHWDYVFVPPGVLHTFMNTAQEEFEVVAFFPKADPYPEVSLSVATGFFPNSVRRAAMTTYAGEHIGGDPLKNLKPAFISPYLVNLKK